MATDSRRHGEPGPAPPTSQDPLPRDSEPASQDTVTPDPVGVNPPREGFLGLIDRATDKPSKAFLLLMLICVPITIIYSPAIIAACLAAEGVGVGKTTLTYLTIASSVATSSLTTGAVITLKLKNLRIRG